MKRFPPLKVQGGTGSVHVEEINAVLPDINNSERCFVYCTPFPDGLQVETPAAFVLKLVDDYLENIEKHTFECEYTVAHGVGE